jgi:hypothetical protein
VIRSNIRLHLLLTIPLDTSSQYHQAGQCLFHIELHSAHLEGEYQVGLRPAGLEKAVRLFGCVEAAA